MTIRMDRGYKLYKDRVPSHLEKEVEKEYFYVGSQLVLDIFKRLGPTNISFNITSEPCIVDVVRMPNDVSVFIQVYVDEEGYRAYLQVLNDEEQVLVLEGTPRECLKQLKNYFHEKTIFE